MSCWKRLMHGTFEITGTRLWSYNDVPGPALDNEDIPFPLCIFSLEHFCYESWHGLPLPCSWEVDGPTRAPVFVPSSVVPEMHSFETRSMILLGRFRLWWDVRDVRLKYSLAWLLHFLGEWWGVTVNTQTQAIEITPRQARTHKGYFINSVYI